MRQDSSQIDQRSNQNRSHYRGKRKEVRTDVRKEASTVGRPQQEEELREQVSDRGLSTKTKKVWM